MATSPTAICNLALRKLGAKRIDDITEDSVNARACRDVYDFVRDSELRKNVWNFAVKEASLAKEADDPASHRARQYQLPSDFIRLAPDFEEDNCLSKDWVVQGDFIFSDDASPLWLRYVARIEDTSKYDPLFDEAFAAKMAVELCETLTQSNSKKAAAVEEYKMAIADAKRVNGIEKRAQPSPDSEWITARA